MKKLILTMIATLSVVSMATEKADGTLEMVSPGLPIETTSISITTGTDGVPVLDWILEVGNEPTDNEKYVIHLDTNKKDCHGYGKIEEMIGMQAVYSLKLKKACIGAKVSSAKVVVTGPDGKFVWEYTPVNGNVI